MNMMKMMQKAGQMKSKMQEMQTRIKDQTVEGEAGNGAVTITMDGGFKTRAVKLDKSVVSADDVELLEDMLVVALGSAHEKANAMIETETKKVMTDLGLPANMDLPF